MGKGEDSLGTKPTRLLSLDALRGFDMLWIIGLSGFFRSLAEANGNLVLVGIAKQTHHVPWEDLRAYDLIFPIFVFISGVAIPYAMKGKLERGVKRSTLALQTLRRTLVLIFLGLVYNGLFDLKFDSLRWASVLGLIGIAYGIGALTYLCTTGFRSRVYWALGLLVGISSLQLIVPVPESGAGILTSDGSINAWIDQAFLPGRLHGGSFDPEGILCCISAGFLTLLGCLTGELLLHRRHPQLRSVWQCALAGTLMILVGWAIWALGYPPIKNAWTGTFNLFAGGFSLILLALFHWSIDFKSRGNWSLPLQIIGMNPLTIYLLARIVPFSTISRFFFGGLASVNETYAQSILFAGVLLIEFALLTLCYRKRIFLRI